MCRCSSLHLVQVRAAYSEEHSVQRNNFSLIKAFASKWPTIPPQPKALLLHICAGGPQAASNTAKGSLPRHVAERRAFGLRLASVGERAALCGFDSHCCQLGCKASDQGFSRACRSELS